MSLTLSAERIWIQIWNLSFFFKHFWLNISETKNVLKILNIIFKFSKVILLVFLLALKLKFSINTEKFDKCDLFFFFLHSSI